MSTKIVKFEDLLAWQKAQDQLVNIYALFRDCKDFSFKDQVQRAGVSVTSNIAEGFERRTNKDFVHFLYIAKASNAEVRSLLHASHTLQFIDSIVYKKLLEKSEEIAKIIAGLIRSLP